MPLPPRTAPILLMVLAGAGCATHTGPAPLPSVPVRSWQVRSSDGGSVEVFFRNDATTTQTISSITLERCVNTREACGEYPVHLVIEPGKTVVGMKVQRFTTVRPFSFGTSYTVDRNRGEGEPVTPTNAARIIPADQVKLIEVEKFVPAVKAITSSGSCGTMQRGILADGQKALVMFFGPSKRSRPERMVSVLYDVSGNALSYSDQRGDFFTKDPAHPDAPRDNPRTIISLDPTTGTGMLRNDGGKVVESYYRVAGPNLLTAASLGRPAELIARIWKECSPGG